MHLWSGSLPEIQRDVDSGTLTGQLIHSFYNHHRCQPSNSEVRSWENSLNELVRGARLIQKSDVGVVIEYHLPYSFSRIDALFLGKDAEGAYSTAVIELKQWSDAKLPDDDSLNVLVMDQEHTHPSQQALDYANHLEEIQSTMVECDMQASPCAFCHNMPKQKITALDDPRFDEFVQQAPLFKKEDYDDFASFLDASVGGGRGILLKDRFINGRFKPNKKLLDILDSVINRDERWNLIDNQRLAYNAIWGKVLALKKAHRKYDHFAIVVKGGPGTGKSVIATQLLADAVRNGFIAAHSTGGKAFSYNLWSKFKGADKLFIWNMHLKNPGDFDLLLVDEAHRIRKTRNMRFTPKSDRATKSQIEEILDAGRIVVFFLDDNQSVRPDEVGTTDLIIQTAQRLNIPVKTYDLQAQFRCGGCAEYLDWINYLFGFSSVVPENWRENYNFSIEDSPDDLEKIVLDQKGQFERNRMVAGFCWPWSDPNPDGTLIPDVVIGDWKRPWNAKAIKSSYPYEKHPYTLWAETSAGEKQIGCIYSAQGFEFDRVGVIWGEDLVWRDDSWVAQRQKSFDNPVKAQSVDTQKYLRNAYRVLLTRGIIETRLLCIDDETREHVIECISEIKP
ncbi:MAG: DNA/RNA helicase domain-containing protein [Methanomicrobiales archaeon]